MQTVGEPENTEIALEAVRIGDVDLKAASVLILFEKYSKDSEEGEILFWSGRHTGCFRREVV